MGLFSKKAPCPICGGKISFFLPTKIEGEYICDDCSGKIDMQQEIKNQLTLQGLKEYLAFYNENQIMKERFIVSQKLDFGCFDTKMIFDFENRLFCMSKNPDKTIFEGAQLKSFTIKEDKSPLFEGSSQGLVRYLSTVPERVTALAPQINMMLMTQRMADTVDRLDDDDDDDDDRARRRRQRVDLPEPFNQFYVELHLEHPYWPEIACDMSAPSFSNDHPDIHDYLNEYEDDIQVMEQLAKALMEVAFPGKGETLANPTVAVSSVAQTSTPPGDAIEEIKKYKKLMEEGVISREEFDAKKKQLLGI